MKTALNSIRIIGGEHRSRVVSVIDAEGLRPTSSRMRETLFNWLMPVLPTAKCVDLFAGSGVLGIEALSRGAKYVTFCEYQKNVYQNLKQNITSIIKDESLYAIYQTDSVKWLNSDAHKMDLLFIDPPFAAHYLPEIIEIINQHEESWGLKYITVEMSAQQIETINIKGFKLKKEMKTKDSYLVFLTKN